MGLRTRFDDGRLKVRHSGEFGGVDYGSETNEVETSMADRKFIALYHKTTAVSGDARAVYARLNLAGVTAGAGYGDAIRALAYVTGTGYANAVGIHSTVAIQVGATATGQSAGLRATFEAAEATRTLSGKVASLIVDSFIGANNTLPTVHGFIRFVDVGTVRMSNLAVIPAASNGTVFATHTTQAMTHSIRIVNEAGVPYYIMCASAATNRG